jgi:hypothetical protein
LKVQVNKISRSTTFISDKELRFQLSTDGLTLPPMTVAKILEVTVTNDAPGGGTSNALTLVIDDATPRKCASRFYPATFNGQGC